MMVCWWVLVVLANRPPDIQQEATKRRVCLRALLLSLRFPLFAFNATYDLPEKIFKLGFRQTLIEVF